MEGLMADYQRNFMDALTGGFQFGQQIKQQRDENQLKGLAALAYGTPKDQRQPVLQQMAGISPKFAEQQKKSWNADDQADQEELISMARFIQQAPPEQKAAAYTSILPKLRDRGMQAPEWGPDTQDMILKTVDSLVGAYGGGTPGGAVQSTYVDSMGNRVAILRDGSTRTLGQNAPNNQIIDTGNGFYGVNKSSLSAAPVMVGGQPQQAPQSSLQAGLYQTPAGMVRIGEGLTPEQQQAALADIQAGGTAQNVQLPARNVAPQQFGGGQQLRSAPKAQVPSGYRANPDGSLSMIPGGPAQVAADARADAAAARKAAEDLKASAKAQEAQQRQSESATTAQNLVSAIDTLTRSPGFSSLGTEWGDTQIAIPVMRNDAKDADAQLKNIAGQVAMATLSRLKSLSATGATGFGALSNQELQLIQNSIATLQSERISNAELRRSLKIIRDGMEKVSNWSPTKQPPAGGSDDIDSLLDMYR